MVVGTLPPPVLIPVSEEISMRIEKQPVVLTFIRLDIAARQLGAQSKRQFVADLRTLTPGERREVADLVTQEG